MSTGFPDQYRNNQNDIWLFSSESGFSVSFTSFDTEKGYDFVSIRNGPDNNNVFRTVKLSGRDIDFNDVYIFDQIFLSVTFRSDFSAVGRGFQMVIVAINTSSTCKYYFYSK